MLCLLDRRFSGSGFTAWKAVCAAVAACGGSAAFAQTATPATAGLHGLVAFGPGVAPRFDGSDRYQPIPFVVAHLSFGRSTIDVQGTSVRAGLLHAGALSFGPALNLRLARKSTAFDREVRLPRIDTAIEAGGFAELGLMKDGQGEPRVRFDLAILRDVSGTHDGMIVAAGASYGLLTVGRVRLTGDVQLRYASKGFMRTYFGVDDTMAHHTGFVPYSPSGALEAGTIGATLDYRLARRWGLLTRLAYSRLTSEASDSPIVEQVGSRGQITAGLALSYRF
ncbi:MAG TPA: MipA/OmpV family protein [Sphingomonas sp.]|nr:MipA/OmpV family protein [Sphingomonas sp.]